MYLPNTARLCERAATAIRPAKRLTPDQWGAKYRVYPASSGRPGPRDPYLTPYAVPIERLMATTIFTRVVWVTASQTAKTEFLLDVIGWRLDQKPVPILYVGPTKDFLVDQFEPRLMALLDEAPTLAAKVARGKRNKKTLKRVAGVTVRLAHAGSSTALKSDPAGLALVDEYDEMLATIKGQGDPLGLVEARGVTYADFVAAVVSTPGRGTVETQTDEATGLEFWAPAATEDVQSPIWRLFQAGTRHHWCWVCPHCDEPFVPRFRQLEWPGKGTEKQATPREARRRSWVLCPRCGGVIEEKHKAALNAGGMFIAPGGHTIAIDGTMTGTLPDVGALSFWTSGLVSPFATFGERAEEYLTALATGELDKIQTKVNANFGECFLPGAADVPKWQELLRFRAPHKLRTLPAGVQVLTAGVDVQGDRLVVIVRGWGALGEVRGYGWLIDRTEILGDTAGTEVWNKLTDYLGDPIEGLPIKVMFVDSGFRPGKKDRVPEHRVYAFCRRHRRVAFATKGVKSARTPLRRSDIEVRQDGKKAGYGLQLYIVDSDHFKSAVHERLRCPLDATPNWVFDADADEHYLRQLVSEARVIKPSGQFEWLQLARANHYLDAEALAMAAGFLLGVQRLTEIGTEGKKPARRRRPPASSAPPPIKGDRVDSRPAGSVDGARSKPAAPPAPAVPPRAAPEGNFERARAASRRLNG